MRQKMKSPYTGRQFLFDCFFDDAEKEASVTKKLEKKEMQQLIAEKYKATHVIHIHIIQVLHYYTRTCA